MYTTKYTDEYTYTQEVFSFMNFKNFHVMFITNGTAANANTFQVFVDIAQSGFKI